MNLLFPPTFFPSLLLFYLMSTHVHTLDSGESSDDEPQEMGWWKENKGRPQRKGKGGSKARVVPKVQEPWQPVEPEVYLGDPTEQEVIDNVQNLPEIRPGGKSQNDFLREWVPWRPDYLKTILAMEAPWDPMEKCEACDHRAGKWRCKQCAGGCMLCGLCFQKEHQFLPFHCVETWNGCYFKVGALWQVGVKLYLSHHGMPCPGLVTRPRETEQSDDNAEGYNLGPTPAATADAGFEGDMWADPEIPVAAEGDDDDDDDVDVMETPTTAHPSTLLRPPPYDNHDYRLSNLECKTSSYQYYQKLRRLTCPAFPKAVLNRYRELRRLSRKYRNMKKWKMHGRAHDEPEGIPQMPLPSGPLTTGTNDGAPPTEPMAWGERSDLNDSGNPMAADNVPRGKLASFCPACPQPGVNLPANWQDDPQRELYTRVFTADGNFKAEHLTPKNEADDVHLTHGEGFMTAPSPYQEHLKDATAKAPCYTRWPRRSHRWLIGGRHQCPRSLAYQSPTCFPLGHRCVNTWSPMCEHMVADVRDSSVTNAFLQSATDVMHPSGTDMSNHSGTEIVDSSGTGGLNILGTGGLTISGTDTLTHSGTTKPACNSHRAVLDGEKSGPGKCAQGISANACARHGCFCPSSVVDFQKGEKQMNMDYSFSEALKTTNIGSIEMVALIYDIMCEYGIHLDDRFYDHTGLTLPQGIAIIKAISLFHVHGHKDNCLPRYATTYIPGLGVIDGEILEILWAVLNAISRSLRLATTAHRTEVIDDHMEDSNWKKTINMASTIVNKYAEARRQEDVKSMDYMNLKVDKPLTRCEIELKLSEKELHTSGQTGQATWISKGLKIEESHIYAVEEVVVDDDVSEEEDSGTEHPTISAADPEGQILPFSSAIPEDFIATLPAEHQAVIAALRQNELNICEGHGDDALDLVQTAVIHLSWQFTNKVRTARPGVQTTRAWDQVKTVMMTLGNHDTVAIKYPFLELEHCRISTTISNPNSAGQSRDRLPWFWSSSAHLVVTSATDTEHQNEFYRVNWLRARAQNNRWAEELNLTKHEMQWTVRWYVHMAEKWKAHRDPAVEVSRGH
ncbi:hypothetical protein BDZ97DRAFT_1759410 [Flammula alnicola]|nr:hypothetical protein BDZ97DRAFT_1759410 [Flammula alnicola]